MLTKPRVAAAPSNALSARGDRWHDRAQAVSPTLAAQLRTVIEDDTRTCPGPCRAGVRARGDVRPIGSARLPRRQHAPNVGQHFSQHHHAAALKVENKVLAELQASAGGPRSGTRLQDYIIDVPDPWRGRDGRRFVRSETHEHEFILYEPVPERRKSVALRIKRDTGTTLRSFEIVGFGRPDLGLPTGAARPAGGRRTLSADPAAAVILQSTSLAWSTADAPHWLEDVAEGIKGTHGDRRHRAPLRRAVQPAPDDDVPATSMRCGSPSAGPHR